MNDHDYSSYKTYFTEHGYVKIPNLIPPSLFEPLKEASSRVTEQTRSGNWPHRRVVGRQFPPYDLEEPDIWGVQHVMNPQLKEKVFAEWYTCDELIGAVCALLGCGEDQLRMELFNLLVNPVNHDFALRWHRDDVPHNATESEEREALGIWHHGVQWNTALYEDACLYVVPGSHAVPRTPEQRAHSSTLDPPKDPMDMPGAIRVILQPGETVFYNSNILHCATYSSATTRATLHACIGDVAGGAARARNVLQHGLEWMTSDEFKNTLSDRGRSMLERLVKMKGDVIGDVGYSLK